MRKCVIFLLRVVCCGLMGIIIQFICHFAGWTADGSILGAVINGISIFATFAVGYVFLVSLLHSDGLVFTGMFFGGIVLVGLVYQITGTQFLAHWAWQWPMGWLYLWLAAIVADR